MVDSFNYQNVSAPKEPSSVAKEFLDLVRTPLQLKKAPFGAETFC